MNETCALNLSILWCIFSFIFFVFCFFLPLSLFLTPFFASFFFFFFFFSPLVFTMMEPVSTVPPPLPRHGSVNESDHEYLPDSSLDVANLVAQNRLEQNREFPPISVDNINQLREESKSSGDSKLQLFFARYLLEAVKHLKPNPQDPNRFKQLKDNLSSEAIKLIKKLASHKVGYADAQFYLGNLYGAGLCVKTDPEKAFTLYLQGSKQNHPECTYRAAVCYELGLGTRKDTRYAMQFYRKAANSSEPSGMYKLAMILLHGLLGQQKNPKEAVSWLTRAATMADTQHPQSVHELAKLYELSNVPSVIPDLDYARELYSQAAQLGFAPSQYKLGLAYENGELHCPIDPRRSIAWYSRAAEQNDPNAELALSGWYLTGVDLILAQNDREAYLWAFKAAEKGLAKAEYAVGYYLEMGIGVAISLQEAFVWYQKAAGHGDTKAKQRLANEKTQVKRRPTRDKNGKPPKDADCKIM
jgi:TPR repeat protein